MKCRLLTLAISLSLLTAGCATTTHMSPQQAARIRTVRLDNNIEMPKSMYYDGPEAAPMMVLFGIAGGGLVSSAIDCNEAKREERTLRQQHISVAAITKQAIVEEFAHRSRYRLANKGPVDATLHVKIIRYGFGVPYGFSSKVKPMVYLAGTLQDNNGRIIWQDRIVPDILSRHATTFYPNEIKNNHHNIVRAFNNAAHQSAQALVTSIQKT